ncbi:putative phage-related lysozyme [Aliarcobacter faecis]|uniref:glycoside hydrolase family protein n=1 Tax=Aliarcobacter faecis TaxID=1564138 RepID=UPI0004795AE7|nr:glycoside hydrolase family protein [Aliarcobacter faecis]QKF72963.1 putative phage-related lysozyme [Aliarcobacter faecis]
MSVIEIVLPFTMQSEGFNKTVYKSPEGFDTIGYGRNIEVNPLTQDELKSIGATTSTSKTSYQLSEEIAKTWLKKELERVKNSLSKELQFFDKLDDVRQAILIDMAYNMGIKGLLSFKNTLKLINDGNYVEASKNMEQSNWYKQVKIRARKLCEAMKSGKI